MIRNNAVIWISEEAVLSQCVTRKKSLEITHLPSLDRGLPKKKLLP
jgi:hypothetical protein